MSVPGPGAVRSLVETRLALTEDLPRLDGKAAEIELLVQQTARSWSGTRAAGSMARNGSRPWRQ